MYGVMVTGPQVSVAITAPADGASIDNPGDVEIVATASSSEMGDLTVLDVSWSVDDVAACDDASVSESGDTTCVTALTAGDHTLSVTVTDPDSGSGAQDVITVHVPTSN